jgi:hypothetical protein
MGVSHEQGGETRVSVKSSARATPVGWIACPEQLVKQAETLLVSQEWEEIVVGLALLSGRCVVEVLKTGVIMPKTRYSFLCTVSLEQADQVLGPFELPTLVEAHRVLEAWQRVRNLVEGEELSVREIVTRYRRQVVQCAKAQFEREVPLVGEQEEWYTPLYAQLYPLLATRYYCPKGKDQAWFAAVVRGLTWPLSVALKLTACACCGEGNHLWGVYQVGDGVNMVEAEVGLKLDEDGVELLESVQEREEPQRAKEVDESPDVQAQGQTPTALHSSWVGKARTEEARNLKEEARQRSDFSEEEWEAYESAVVLEACKQIQQEQAETALISSADERMCILYLDELLAQRLEQVRQREGTSTVDATLAVLLDGYEWLHRGGSLPPLRSSERTQAGCSLGEGPPLPYAIRGVTEDRLVVIDQVKAAKGLEKVIEQVLDAYETPSRMVCKGDFIKKQAKGENGSIFLKGTSERERDR